MSTAPHNSPETAKIETHVTVPSEDRGEVDASGLDAAVLRFEAAAKSLKVNRPPQPELKQLCLRVAAFTSELFPGDLAVEIRVDPEIADDLYFVFEVRATGSLEEIVARDEQWHRRLVSIGRDWPGLFRLSIDAH